MAGAGQYRDLLAWQRAVELVTEIYSLTRQFPEDERFGLTNQLRRAAVSVPSNIAEGYGRQTDKQFVLFLANARGSLYEVETQLEIAKNLHYLTGDASKVVSAKSDEVRKLLHGLIRSRS